MARASSPPESHLGEGKDRLARVRPQEEGDVVAGVGIGHGHLDPGLGHGQAPQAFLDRPGELGCGPVPRRAHGGLGRGHYGVGVLDLDEELAGAHLGRVELGQLASGLRREGEDPGRPLAVLARELPEQLTPGPDLFESLGVVLPRLDDVAELGGGVRRVGLERCQASGELGQGAPTVESSSGRAQQVDNVPGPVVTVVEGGERGCRRVTVRRRLRQSVLFVFERVLFVGVVQPGGVRSRRVGSGAGRLGVPGPGRRRPARRARPAVPAAGRALL